MSIDILVNRAIFHSIPIDKDLKRYLLNWYKRMVTNNGRQFATDKVKQLRVSLMEYRAHPNRLKRMSKAVEQMPIRKNWLLFKLIGYMDSQPHFVLALLKFPFGSGGKPDVDAAAVEHQQLLSSISKCPSPPSFLDEWLNVLFMSISARRKVYRHSKANINSLYHKYCSYHSLQEWEEYWRTWHLRLVIIPKKEMTKHSKYNLRQFANVIPNPAMYKDLKGNISRQYERDAKYFVSFLVTHPELTGISSGYLSFIQQALPEDHYLRDVRPGFRIPYPKGHMVQGCYPVGDIHYVRKPGTDSLRPIAVPNRFLQFGLKPLQEFLYSIIRRFPRDHTFCQTKTARYVQHRVDNGYYVASIDLSKATDYFPMAITDSYLDRLFSAGGVAAPLILGRLLFQQMARGGWQNSRGDIVRWLVGQPLGTFPSFGYLALGHNLMLESLSLSEGYGHSPYLILGDDLLVFSKRIRQRYAEAARSLGMPISWHKSYEHNLVEFAGLLHVKNNGYRYSPDHYDITLYNVFDYSRNSGIEVQFRYLPKQVRRWFDQRARRHGKDLPLLDGRGLYELATELYCLAEGSPRSLYTQTSVELLPEYIALSSPDDNRIPKYWTSGWYYSNDTYIDAPRYIGVSIISRDPRIPTWIKEKFKPDTTRSIVSKTERALATARLDC